jgi:ribosomal protein RSM22 (predicted rRNA methylase)
MVYQVETMTDYSSSEPRTILTLPDDLRAAIERMLAGVPAERWVRDAQALSERYRRPRAASQGALAHGERDALAYAALIMPATYAQLYGALAAVAARVPGWAPTTMLDLGSGPGTALWAALERWPSLRDLEAWEREPAFLALGRELARGSRAPVVRAARWERVDLRAWSQEAQSAERRAQTDAAEVEDDPSDRMLKRFDVVVLGHVLNELEPAEQARVLAAAWGRTAGLLLIVEPGTPEAFAVVRAARDALLAAGAATIAPCVHDRPCPLENDWCHFPQRLWRPDFQRRARGAPSQWEQSKYTYAALARFPPEAPIWGRVIREPSHNKAYAEVTISTRAGVGRFRAPKRQREAFRLVKDLAWGAALEEPLIEPIAPADSQG